VQNLFNEMGALALLLSALFRDFHLQLDIILLIS
jgi:hypothetical protein